MRKILVIIFLLFFISSFCQDTVALTLGKKQSFFLTRNNSKNFNIRVLGGKSYKIICEQKGIDIVLKLKSKEGKELLSQDSPNGRYGPEIINFSTKNSGDFTVTLEPLLQDGNSNKGKVTILMKEEITDKLLINRTLSPKQMSEDLDIFRKIREEANSGLYAYRTKRQIDSIYTWAENESEHSRTISEFYMILLTLTDFEGSNHNGTELPYDITYYLPGDQYFPLFLKWVNNKAVVNNDNFQIPLGAEIKSINGFSVEEIQKRFYKYYPTDGYNLSAKQRLSLENSFGWLYPFEFGNSDKFNIEFTRPYSNISETISLESVDAEKNNELYFSRHSAQLDSLTDFNIQEKYSIKELSDNTALLNFRIFDMAANEEDPQYKVYSDFLDSIFIKLKKQNFKHLIIDIRGNPGGNDPTYEKAFTYLTNKPFKENIEAFIIFNNLPYPEHFKWNSTDKQNQKRELREIEKYLRSTFPDKNHNKFYQDPRFNPAYYPNENKFEGNIYLIIDENVGSAASHFASLIRAYTDAIIVGTETSGGYYRHNGHYPVEYILPNSQIVTRFSIVSVTQDAIFKDNQPIGRGIIPDHNVPQTLEDFLINEDTQIKYILKLIEGNK